MKKDIYKITRKFLIGIGGSESPCLFNYSFQGAEKSVVRLKEEYTGVPNVDFIIDCIRDIEIYDNKIYVVVSGYLLPDGNVIFKKAEHYCSSEQEALLKSEDLKENRSYLAIEIFDIGD